MRSCWMLESGGNMISLLELFYFSIDGWLGFVMYSLFYLMCYVSLGLWNVYLMRL